MTCRLHFCVVVGGWKFENYHLYRWTRHCAVKKPGIVWHTWDRVI